MQEADGNLMYSLEREKENVSGGFGQNLEMVRHNICHLNTCKSLTTVVKMVGRSVDKKDEIRAYIKALSKPGCSLKQLMTELSTAYGPSCGLMTQFGSGKWNLSLV